MFCKIGLSLLGFSIVYFCFDSFGTGRLATIGAAKDLNDHVQDSIIPKYYPSRESIGISHEDHQEFMKREHPKLTQAFALESELINTKGIYLE
jgi:hypothetical protein